MNNIKSRNFFFRCLYFLIGLYHVQADISRAILTAKQNAINEFRFTFYEFCHLNPVEYEAVLPLLIPYLPPISDKDVTFLFFSRNNPWTPKVIVGNEPASNIANLNIDFDKETLIFCDGGLLPAAIPALTFPAALLPQNDINIIIVDWDLYVFLNPIYSFNVTVPRLGNVIGEFLEKLISVGLDPKKTTLMGFSFGSPAMGLAAKKIRPKIARLIAFSSYGICFDFQPNDQRLTIGDADYVVIVHSTSGIFEYTPDHLGNATFYMNGGILQPFCEFLPTVLVQNFCSHVTGMLYMFVSLLNSNILNGVKCDSYEDYVRGECDCTDTAALIYSIPPSTNGSYFVDFPFPSKKLCKVE